MENRIATDNFRLQSEAYIGAVRIAAGQLEARFRAALAQDAKVEMHW